MRAKGGNPRQEIPVYMFLGEVLGEFEKFGPDTACLKIPLSELDLTAVSFVWPDSMYEMVVDENGAFTGEGRRTNTPRVYMPHELDEAMELANRFNAMEHKRVPYAGIEAQVWDRAMLHEWYEKTR